MKTFLRILIIAAILLILVFLSIGIVRVVPKALSSLASATVSIGSIFGGNDKATTTPDYVPDPNASSTGGFIIVGTSTPGTTKATSTKTNTGVSMTKNYVPKPAGTTGTGSSYGSTYTYTGPATCTAGGYPNIAVTILSKGVINSAGQFVETNTFTTNDMVAVKFKVENRGTCPTGKWGLVVQMPAQNSADQIRNLSGNTSLPAGAAVTGQANFTSPRLGNSSVILTVADSSGKDANASDNTTSSAITVIAGTGNTGGTGISGNFPVYGDGRPDLIVKVLQVGVLDYNNRFTPVSNQNFQTGSRVAVKFQVINQGRSATGPWTFRAEVNDAYQPRVYQNQQNENSIPSGGSSIYTVSFDNLSTGSHTMNLFADSLNQVNEFNEGNNSYGVIFYMNY